MISHDSFKDKEVMQILQYSFFREQIILPNPVTIITVPCLARLHVCVLQRDIDIFPLLMEFIFMFKIYIFLLLILTL